MLKRVEDVPATPTPENEPVVAGAATMAGAIYKLAGAIAALSAISIAAGHAELSAYFRELGAPWLMSLVSPSHFPQQSAIPLTLLVLFTILAHQTLGVVKAFTSSAFLSVGMVAMGIATVSCAVLLVLPELFKTANAYYLATQVVMILECIALAFTLIASLAHIGESKSNLPNLYLTSIFLCVFGWAFFVPTMIGIARAHLHLDRESHYVLPYVAAPELKPKRTWKLVMAVEGGFLVMADNPGTDGKLFRVISAAELGEIRRTIFTKEDLEEMRRHEVIGE